MQTTVKLLVKFLAIIEPQIRWAIPLQESFLEQYIVKDDALVKTDMNRIWTQIQIIKKRCYPLR